MPQNKQRPGFMVYFGDWEAPRQLLNPEQFKVFFDAAFNYAQDGEIPGPFEDHMIKVFFDTFMPKLNADNERYQETCRKRSEAAKKSHGANASNSQQMQANAANTNTNPNNNNNTNNNPNTNINPNVIESQSEYQHQDQDASKQMQEARRICEYTGNDGEVCYCYDDGTPFDGETPF